MAKSSQHADRKQAGRYARQQVPRNTHTAIGDTHRDPVRLLKANSEGRVPALVPLRYGRMLASPFTFFRGSAILQAHDLSATPHSGFITQICGDCHLSNFGGFATPERTLIFDLNDFDETAPGPWEWDLKRLVASFVVAARHLGHSDQAARTLVRDVVGSYQEQMNGYADMGILEIWHERFTFEEIAAKARTKEGKAMVLRAIERAGKRTHEDLLPKLADRIDGRWQVRDAPPAVFHIQGRSTLFSHDDDWMGVGDWLKTILPVYRNYRKSLPSERSALLDNFEIQDLAFKVVGVGSVGTRCLAMLLTDAHDTPLFLQFKEASTSVISRYFHARVPKHDGQRVVEGQRLMQAATDAFLGWTAGPLGRPLYGRQLRDMKISADLELMKYEILRGYARLCGNVLARAHAKASGKAIEISTYIGSSERFAAALETYAVNYADQVEKDYEVFRKACRNGKLEARTDADMAADISLT